ncbi:MAG: antibiotic biosynthesis monooxygenase family protein [Desulfobacteraceae bacterium]
MILVRITMQVMEEKQKEVVQTLLSLMHAMDKEEGCLGYAFMTDISDGNILYIHEEWENREKLDQHLKSDLFGVLLGLKSLLLEPHDIHIYTVDKAEGMNAVLYARSKREHGIGRKN